MKNLIKQYFNFWQNKNLNGLDSIFADDITLRDWNISLSGKSELLNINSTLFNDIQKITVNIINLYEDTNKNTVICEIEIDLDGEVLLVTDIIKINKEDKIESIIAYKG